MEKKEIIGKLITGTALVLVAAIASVTYKSVEGQKNSISMQQSFSLAVQSISNVKPEMQGIYVISLGSYGKTAIPVILKLMGTPVDSPAHSGAGIALQVMGDEASGEVFKAAQDNSLPTDFRKSAVAALGKIGGQKSKDILIKLAENRRELNLLRNQALKSLLNYSNIENIENIWKLLESEDRTSGTLYQSTLDLLFDISARLAATKEVEISPNAKVLVARGLDSKKNDVRFFAVKMLGALGDTANIAAIEKIAQLDPSDYVKKEATEVLNLLKAHNTEAKR